MLAKLLRWLGRKLKAPCPECGSKGHKMRKIDGDDLWQCAACGRYITDPHLAECPDCGNPYLDPLRECQDCWTIWNPRTVEIMRRME